jgi:hypothetical protein
MGIIYKITSPEGKTYIGQTRKTLLDRWRKHVQCSNSETREKHTFYDDILKFGADSFTVEKIWEGPNDELNFQEQINICCENSHYSEKGYNLTYGGGCTRKDKGELHDYITKIADNKQGYQGYRVDYNGKSYNCTGSGRSMEEKLLFAQDCVRRLIAGEDYKIRNKRKKGAPDEFTIPMYVVKRGANGFAVNRNGYKRKTFDHVHNTRKQNLINAIIYLFDKNLNADEDFSINIYVNYDLNDLIQ